MFLSKYATGFYSFFRGFKALNKKQALGLCFITFFFEFSNRNRNFIFLLSVFFILPLRKLHQTKFVSTLFVTIRKYENNAYSG